MSHSRAETGTSKKSHLPITFAELASNYSTILGKKLLPIFFFFFFFFPHRFKFAINQLSDA